jgi:beta-galactosidase GanA
MILDLDKTAALAHGRGFFVCRRPSQAAHPKGCFAKYPDVLPKGIGFFA